MTDSSSHPDHRKAYPGLGYIVHMVDPKDPTAPAQECPNIGILVFEAERRGLAVQELIETPTQRTARLSVSARCGLSASTATAIANPGEAVPFAKAPSDFEPVDQVGKSVS